MKKTTLRVDESYRNRWRNHLKHALTLGILGFGLFGQAQEYCVPTSSNTSDYLSAISSNGGITNIDYSINSFVSGYEDQTSQELKTILGSEIELLTSFKGGTYSVNFWIDYNQDGEFSEDEKVARTISSESNNPATTTILLRDDVSEGNYRLRIRGQWSSSNNPAPCGNITFGSAVDFTLILQAPEGCSEPSMGVASLSLNQGGVSNTITTSVRDIIALEGLIKQWQISTNNGETWENIEGANHQNSTITTPENTGVYWYRFALTCSHTQATTYSNVLVYTAYEVYELPEEGSSTIQTCSAIIYDDGGANGYYSNSYNGYMIIRPTEGNLVQIQGTTKGENGFDRLIIYDGEGINEAAILYNETLSPLNSSNAVVTVPLITSISGALTVQLTSDSSTNNEGFELIVSCVEAPECMNPSQLTTSNITPTTATSTWAASLSDAPQYEYAITLNNEMPSAEEVQTTTETTAEWSDLSPETVYFVWVRAICTENATSEWISTSFKTDLEGRIGGGNTNSTSLPLVSNYAYNYSQQIVPQELIENAIGEGQQLITKIKFYYVGSTSTTLDVTRFNNWTVYLANTNQDSFETTSSWITPNSLQQVFSGELDFSTGNSWVEIELDTPFIWNGEGNLVIGVHEVVPNYTSIVNWGTFVPEQNVYKSIYYRSDSTLPNLDNIQNANGRNYFINQIALSTGELPSCLYPTSINIVEIGSYSASIEWNNTDAESYLWYVYDANADITVDEPLFEGTTTETNITLEGLTSDTAYVIYVQSICTEADSDLSLATHFRTEISCPAPTDFTASVSLNSATISWVSGGTTFDIEYGETGFELGTGTVITNVNSGYLIESLLSSTTYQVYIKQNCGVDGFSTNLVGSFTTLTEGQIGTGTTSTSYFPIYSLYEYNYSQQIYLSEELTAVLQPGSTLITKIRFKQNSVGTYQRYKDWKVWMKNTELDAFSGYEDFVPNNELTEVFNGEILTFAANTWVEIVLDTPFQWDGTSNLLVSVYENTPNYSSSSFASFNAGANRGIILYNDTYSNVNIDNPDFSSTYKQIQSNIAQIQIVAEVDPELNVSEFDMNAFKVYPNPVKDIVTISYNKSIDQVNVYNMLGQEVVAKSVNAQQSQIDLSNLPSGNYIIKVAIEGTVKTVKVIKH